MKLITNFHYLAGTVLLRWNRYVLTGEYNKAVKEPTEQFNPVQQVFIHSNYNKNDLTNDIGTRIYIHQCGRCTWENYDLQNTCTLGFHTFKQNYVTIVT